MHSEPTEHVTPGIPSDQTAQAKAWADLVELIMECIDEQE